MTRMSYQKPSYDTYIEKGQTFPIEQFTKFKVSRLHLANDKRKLILLFATWCSDSQRFVKQLTHPPLLTDPNYKLLG